MDDYIYIVLLEKENISVISSDSNCIKHIMDNVFPPQLVLYIPYLLKMSTGYKVDAQQ